MFIEPLRADFIRNQFQDLEYSIHLVLPPAPAPSAPAFADSPSAAPAPTQEAVGGASINTMRTPFLAANTNPFAASNFPHAQGIRFRGNVPTATRANDADLAHLRPTIEAIRRQVEQLERGGNQQARPVSQATATNPFGSHVQSPSFPQQATWQRMSHGFSNPSISAIPQHPSSVTTNTSSLHFTMPSTMPSTTSSTARSSVAESDLTDFTDNQQLQLQILRHQIALGEDQLSRGIAPPFDHIVRLRAQLFQILDDQYRNPLARRDGSVESLLTRVSNMYNRADQLRILQARASISLQNNLGSSVMNPDPSTAPLYLLSSPDGHQSLITSPGGTGSIQAAFRTAHIPTSTTPAHTTGQAPEAHAQPNPAVMENVVRQAVLNHQLNNQEHQIGLARTIRRMWLFIRLYFFCYMFSEPGTWTRIFFVCLAAMISLLSDTGVPRQLHSMFVAPVQRHMEGVIQIPRLRRPSASQNAADLTRQPTRDNHREAQPTGLRHNVRRAERSLLFFMASLIPGVSERYVEVNNAVEAENAQREREEENRRRQEEATQTDADADNADQETVNPHAHPERTVTNADERYTAIPQEEDR